MNGREWLCWSLAEAGIGFRRRDNCLVQVDDQAAAQKLLDAQPWHDWSAGLNALFQQACPALAELQMQG